MRRVGRGEGRRRESNLEKQSRGQEAERPKWAKRITKAEMAGLYRNQSSQGRSNPALGLESSGYGVRCTSLGRVVRGDPIRGRDWGFVRTWWPPSALLC